jgi:pimeloyl-ACP methyl ester carboxylesterase
MDALHIEHAVLAGFDWGARTANCVAALRPERCTAMVSVSGYLIGSQVANKTPLPLKGELAWWYSPPVRSSPCRRSRSKATPTARRIRARSVPREVLGPVCTPDDPGRRPQPAAGSTTGVRQRRDRGRWLSMNLTTAFDGAVNASPDSQ